MDDHLKKDDSELSESELRARNQQLDAERRNEGIARMHREAERRNAPHQAAAHAREEREQNSRQQQKQLERKYARKRRIRGAFAFALLLGSIYFLYRGLQIVKPMPNPMTWSDIPGELITGFVMAIASGIAAAYAFWQNKREEVKFRMRSPG